MGTPPRERSAPRFLILGALALAGCRPPPDTTLSVVGTSDLHGRLEGVGGKGGVALLGGYLRNLRTHNPVVLVDGGDLFQGTLLSNLHEGAPVVRAMNALGYHAAAIGNHDFDYGPVGPDAVTRTPGDDPRGALKARAREARFVLLAANVLEQATGKPVAWPNVAPQTLVEVAGVRVGIVGGTTVTTPSTTNAMNLRGLAIDPLPARIAEAAQAVRRGGAEVVVAVVHAGGKCADTKDPEALGSCVPDSELFRLARALPPGSVDVVVGGHTHAMVAHRVAGVAVIESGWGAEAFGRVDLTLDGRTHRVVGTRIFPPHKLSAGESYEGAPALADPAVAKSFAADLADVAALREQPLGVEVTEPLWRSYDVESPLGNLVADVLRAAVPDADFALYNGGGLRAELAKGPLTYGALYEVVPFDNRLAVLTLRGATLRKLLRDNYAGAGNGFLSVSGLTARARCTDGEVALELARPSGGAIEDAASYRVVVSDFLANGGDKFDRALAADGTHADILWNRPTIHEIARDALRARGGRLRVAELYDPAQPRARLPGVRPICQPR
jgi:5'-nucleotidase